MNDILEMAQGNLTRVIAVRLRPGTDVLAELPDKKAGYGYGEVLHLTGPIELTAGSGIICHDDQGNTNLHVHMSLSDRYGNAHGGHLVEGTKVLLTVDVVIAEIGGLVMGRKFDEELEVPLFAPKQA